MGGQIESNPTTLSPFDALLWNAVVERLEFSARQAEIVALLLACKRDKEILDELGIRVGTFRTHLERACNRAGARDRQQLIVRVLLTALELKR